MSANLERNLRQVSLMVITNGIIFYLFLAVFIVSLCTNTLVQAQLDILSSYQHDQQVIMYDVIIRYSL